MVDAVRSTGATNVLLLGGLAWASDLGGYVHNTGKLFLCESSRPLPPAGENCSLLEHAAAKQDFLSDGIVCMQSCATGEWNGTGWDNYGWLKSVPADPLQNLAASWHSYEGGPCSLRECWESSVAGAPSCNPNSVVHLIHPDSVPPSLPPSLPPPLSLPPATAVAAKYPVVATETGFNYGSTNTTWIDSMWRWSEHHGLSYLAWTWNAWAPSVNDESLIVDYNGMSQSDFTSYLSPLTKLLTSLHIATGTATATWGIAWKSWLANINMEH